MPRSAAGAYALASLFDARRPWCTATETFRTKVSVDHTVRRSGGIVTGVVSPWPGEGKSTVTLNMARMPAEVGARVLVVDADLRESDPSDALASRAALLVLRARRMEDLRSLRPREARTRRGRHP